jgi:hypothetical protein
MRDDELDFPEDDDFDPLLDDLEDDLEDGAGASPPPAAPMSRQEMDAVVDQVLAEELSRLKPGRKSEN